MNNTIELLAPAGNYECFKAAICGGADAIYLGLNRFGARANADNFSVDELVVALDEAHLFGKKIYLTVNTLFKDNEFEELYRLLEIPYLNGLDGVIVQDLGVVSFIREHFPKLPVHASTQMAITDVSGARLLKGLGITRVVLARELSLKEIRRIHDETGVEIECFAHGALCYSYSGKCLYSSFLGGRSGNRGRCAQPCRLAYDGQYLLSMKDLCTIDALPEMLNASISSFKIEGRMKSPEYVYGVTTMYRKYLDKACKLSNNSYNVDRADKEILLSRYSRTGNCQGYLKDKNGRNMITIKSPSYSSNADSDASKNYLKMSPTIDVNMKCILRENQNICILINANNCNENITSKESSFEYDIIPQKAQKAALTEEAVAKQLCKTGGTVFNVKDIDVDIEGDLFLPNSQINMVRRCALDDFTNALLSAYKRDKKDIIELSSRDSSGIAKGDVKKAIYPYDYRASIISADQLGSVLRSYMITSVIIPISVIEDIEMNALLVKAIRDRSVGGLNIYIRLPDIIRDTKKGIGESKVRSLLDKGIALFEELSCPIAGVYVSNYEGIEIVKRYVDNNKIAEVIGDIHVYTLNNYAINELKKLGVNKTTLPVELTYKELCNRGFTGEEVILYGRIPMMVSTQCVYNTKNQCNYNSSGHIVKLNDRRNAVVSVYCNCKECTNIIYNSVPLDLTGEASDLIKLAPSSFRLMFTTEDDVQILDVLDRLEKFNDNIINSYTIDESGNYLSEEFTKGHFRKGIE